METLPEPTARNRPIGSRWRRRIANISIWTLIGVETLTFAVLCVERNRLYTQLAVERFTRKEIFTWKRGEIADWALPLARWVEPAFLPKKKAGSGELRINIKDDLELVDSLPDVTELHVEAIGLSDVAISRLGRLRQVRELAVNRCYGLTDYRLGRFRRFPLRRLSIMETPVSHVGLFLLDLRQLESLRVEYSVLSKARTHELPRLARVKELAVLRDDDRERIYWEFLRYVPDVESLEISVDVAGRAFEELPRLRKLRHLKLTAVEDDHLEAIGKVRDVSSLDLEGNFRGERLDQLAGCQPKHLALSSRHLNGEAFASIARLPGLESLSVQTSIFGARPLEHLAHCPDLKELSIDGIGVSDLDVPMLLRIPKLSSLKLRNTWITKAGADQIRSVHPELKLDYVSDFKEDSSQ